MRRIFLLLFVLAVFFQNVRADEGMWLPSLVQKLNIGDMKALGCQLSADDIYSINHSSLKDAVVALDHGSCTGELVSADGLLLTNHHCGFAEIQEHSSVDHDYLKDGFWAKTRKDELPNPGKTVSFLIRIEDVTDQVLDSVKPGNTEAERLGIIEKACVKIQKEAAKDSDYEARVQSMFSGNRYYLFVYETFRDIRLVGAPPASIGKFGGDTDNWMWPRHTGDFSIFRVYCSPDGKPADYSPDNVPFHPKRHLTISLKGYQKGDFAMIMGYPGSTNRYKSSYGVKYTMDVTNTVRIQVRSKKLEILKNYMNTSQKANIQYASKYASSSNYYKYSIGQNKGLKALHVIKKKQDLENQFRAWVAEDSERQKKYGQALDLIKDAYQDTRDENAYEYMVEAIVRGPEIFYYSYGVNTLYEALKNGASAEQIKADAERLKAEVDNYFKDYDAATDAKVAAALLKLYKENVDPRFYPDFFKVVDKKYKGNFVKYVDKMFSKTIFASKEDMKTFLASPDLKTLQKDKAFQTTLSVFNEFAVIGDAMNETGAELLKGRRLFLAGLMQMEKDRKFYPDANSTMRLTYGTIGGYSPRDAVYYKYYTTMKGYLEKEIPGDDEFSVPQHLKELYAKKDFGQYEDQDGTMHTCFLTNNDITGGNSGSPVMNSKGELIGLAFDGNWEAMSGDLAFEPQLQRCICVDVRFVLWTIDKYAGDTRLINEMTLDK